MREKCSVLKGFKPKIRIHTRTLEDDIINRGVKVRRCINFLKSVRNMLAGSSGGVNMTVKWDGAPIMWCQS